MNFNFNQTGRKYSPSKDGKSESSSSYSYDSSLSSDSSHRSPSAKKKKGALGRSIVKKLFWIGKKIRSSWEEVVRQEKLCTCQSA